MSAFTDEELYARYHAATQDDLKAAEMVEAHRRRYPAPDPDRGGDWTGIDAAQRDAILLEVIKKAAILPEGAERTALIDHALGGAAVRAEAVAKGKR